MPSSGSVRFDMVPSKNISLRGHRVLQILLFLCSPCFVMLTFLPAQRNRESKLFKEHEQTLKDLNPSVQSTCSASAQDCQQLKNAKQQRELMKKKIPNLKQNKQLTPTNIWPQLFNFSSHEKLSAARLQLHCLFRFWFLTISKHPKPFKNPKRFSVSNL